MGWLEIFETESSQNNLNLKNHAESQTSIIVVDDEEDIVSTLESFLSLENYYVYTAKTGLEALEIYRSQAPRIIITDILMPGMNGIELLNAIRETDEESEVIVLTGHADTNIAINAIKNKASDFLTKPVNLEVLLHSVQKSESYLKLKDDIKTYTRELEELFKDVYQSKESMENMLQKAPNATITYNLDGKITSWNDAAQKITGYNKAETVGKYLKEIFVFDNHLIDSAAAHRSHAYRENIVGQILTKRQQIRYISRNANILLDQNNKVIGGIESFYDITDKTNNDRLLEKRYLQVQTINEIGKKVVISSKVDDLIDFISKRLVTTFYESAKVFFFLYSDQEKSLQLRAASGIDIDNVLKNFPVGSCLKDKNTLASYVFSTGKSVLNRNVSKSSMFKKSICKDVQSAFAFPIKTAKKKYGVIHIENAERLDLDDSDIFMLETISEYLAISMDKIELLEKITNQNSLLEKQADDLKSALKKVESQKEIIEVQNKILLQDLKKAADFQITLLPEYLPQRNGYKFSVSFTPSFQLGGDLYDIFEISDRYIGIIVADASGHGVSSAMLSAMFKMTLGKYATSDIDPASVFSKLNSDFCQVVQTGDFFSAFYGVIDLDTNRFIYSNAAHPKPMLYSYETDQIIEFDSEGFLLGITNKGISFEKKEYRLTGKYRLLIYTDGLHEAINKKEVAYGEERVRKELKKYASSDARKYLDCVVKNLKRYTQSKTFDDDLTMVVMDIDVK
jgi:phosphoserine phosphatase RsbU/P